MAIQTPIRSVSEAVYIDLKKRMLQGQFEPGAELRESTLAQTLDVSRGPVREAIRRLEAEGLVEIIPRHGARVVSVSSRKTSDLLDARESLEGMAARLAAVRATPKELRLIRVGLDNLCAELEEKQSGYPQDKLDFHAELVRLAQNEMLTRFLKLIEVQATFIRVISGNSRVRAVHALEEHYEILAVLEEGDPDEAEARMRKHIRSVKSSFRGLVTPSMMTKRAGGE